MITVIKNYSLSDIRDSIKYLLDKASRSEQVRGLALSLASSKEPIPAIYDWTISAIKYTPDPYQVELFTSPVKLVNDYYQGNPVQEDCDGISLMMTALYRAVGLRSDVVLLDTENKGLDHAISQVYSTKLGKFLMVDASTNKIPLGWEQSYYQRVVI